MKVNTPRRGRDRAPVALAALLLAAIFLLAAPAAGAQMIDENRPTPSAEASRYARETSHEIESALARWQKAWGSHDLNALADAYTKDAVVTVADSTVRGRPAIRAWLERALPKTGSAMVTVQDFIVSDEVAFVSGQLTYSVELPDGGSERKTGPYAATFRREWSYGWRVRSWVAPHALPPVDAR